MGERLKGLLTYADINHNKVVTLPDWALLPLLENTGLCSRRLESRERLNCPRQIHLMFVPGVISAWLFPQFKSGLPPSNTAKGGRPGQHFLSLSTSPQTAQKWLPSEQNIENAPEVWGIHALSPYLRIGTHQIGSSNFGLEQSQDPAYVTIKLSHQKDGGCNEVKTHMHQRRWAFTPAAPSIGVSSLSSRQGLC